MTTELRAQRQALKEAEYDSYSPDDFPGSKAWKDHRRAMAAVAAFDAEHPEIIAQMRAEAAAKKLAEKPLDDANTQRLFDAGLI